jgi:DNA-binding MarR family transcriptional regulator
MRRTVSGEASVEESIVLALFDLSNQLSKLGEGLAGPAGLSAQQWLVLLQVAGDPNFHSPGGRGSLHARGVMASEIAEARGVSRPNVSALVAQLMAKGFVRQKEEPTDRRRKGLFMTARGRAALRRLEAGRRLANRALLADLTPDDRAALLQALRACLARAWRPSTRGFGVGPGEVT